MLSLIAHFFFAASFFLGCATAQSQSKSSPESSQLSSTSREARQSDFDYFRENAPHFWHWSKSHSDSLLPQEVLHHKGLVTGDPHLLNFADRLVAGPKLAVNLIDFDDSGDGPFILDFLRLAVGVKLNPLNNARTYPQGFVCDDESVESQRQENSESSSDVVSLQELFYAYIAGLESMPGVTPDLVAEAERLSPGEVTQNYDKYIQDVVEKGPRLDRKKLNLQDLKAAPAEVMSVFNAHRADFELALKNYQILDTAWRIKKGGGSKGMIRFVYLARSLKDRRLKVFEFKELQLPAVAKYSAQQSAETRYRQLQAKFWKDTDSTQYRFISGKDRNFWMRIRHSAFIDLEQSVSANRDKSELIRDMHLYIANSLGSLHRQGGADPAYIEGLKSNSSKLLSQLKAFSKSYRQALLDLQKHREP